jgi:phospholipase/carboxylesterase
MNYDESATGAADQKAGSEGLETVEVCTGQDPSAAIIWLHGLGADGHDFEPFVPQLTWTGGPAIRFVFPHAPERPVTVNNGMRMRAWYDILSITAERGHDQQGIVDSVNLVAQLIGREQRRGIPSSRIVVAGFSQGGAIALQLAPRFPEKLAGLIGLSTYLLFPDRLKNQAHASNRDLPVFMAHGTMDQVVPFSMGEAGAEAMRDMGYSVEWHSYPVAHGVCPEEAAHIAGWLKNLLG